MRYVYFIKPIGMDGPIKIGCSSSPELRRSTLATWSPFALEIVARLPGDATLERRFHARFYAQHERREWFTWTPDLQATIDAITVGVFDIESLPAPRKLPTAAPGKKLGTKWSPEQRARTLLWNKLRRIERETGLVPDYPISETAEAFVADPHTHGITPEERSRRNQRRLEALKLAEARAALAQLEAAA